MKLSSQLFAGLIITCVSTMVITSASIATTPEQAASSMLKQADVPSSFGKPTGYGFSSQYSTPILQGCWMGSGAPAFSQVATPIQFRSTIPTDTGSNVYDLSEQVFQYPTAQAASAAAVTYAKNAMKCQGTTKASFGQGAKESVTYTHGSVAGKATGTWVSASAVPVSVPISGPPASMLTLTTTIITIPSGSALIQVGVVGSGISKLNAQQHSAAQQLALSLAKRWTY